MKGSSQNYFHPQRQNYIPALQRHRTLSAILISGISRTPKLPEWPYKDNRPERTVGAVFCHPIRRKDLQNTSVSRAVSLHPLIGLPLMINKATYRKTRLAPFIFPSSSAGIYSRKRLVVDNGPVMNRIFSPTA